MVRKRNVLKRQMLHSLTNRLGEAGRFESEFRDMIARNLVVGA
jgi:hypothetical protein